MEFASKDWFSEYYDFLMPPSYHRAKCNSFVVLELQYFLFYNFIFCFQGRLS